jgi:hypothetical protein
MRVTAVMAAAGRRRQDRVHRFLMALAHAPDGSTALRPWAPATATATAPAPSTSLFSR